MQIFGSSELKNLFQPLKASSGEDNGQLTIIGGSSLFHGAPILALKTASRIVDMVFFASPEKSVGQIAEKSKSQLMSFIWIPWEDREKYIAKSDAVLIGPGFMRFSNERVSPANRYLICDESCQISKTITEELLKKFPAKKWVVDAGSLQTISCECLPRGSIITPNKKEFNLLFKEQIKAADFTNPTSIKKTVDVVQKKARKYQIFIVLKGVETIVASPTESVLIKGGNPGLTKGGTGDIHAGLTAALLAKNEPFLAAAAAAYIIKASADSLYRKVGVNYNADDLTDSIPAFLASATIQ